MIRIWIGDDRGLIKIDEAKQIFADSSFRHGKIPPSRSQ